MEVEPVASILMESIKEREKGAQRKEDDADDFFCRSPVATLKDCLRKQLLFHIEFEGLI